MKKREFLMEHGCDYFYEPANGYAPHEPDDDFCGSTFHQWGAWELSALGANTETGIQHCGHSVVNASVPKALSAPCCTKQERKGVI